VLSGIALLSFRLAKAPRDKEHPYGHLICISMTWKVRDFGSSRNLLYAFGNSRWHCIFACHAVDILMIARHLFNTAFLSICRDCSHLALKWLAMQWHMNMCIVMDMEHPILALNMTILSICIKEGGSILGVKFLDPLAGLLVSGMILKAGAETGYQSILGLVDAAIPASI
ncbi:hypothetical protein S245_024912, partial [Arachis hypogaea]